MKPIDISGNNANGANDVSSLTYSIAISFSIFVGCCLIGIGYLIFLRCNKVPSQERELVEMGEWVRTGFQRESEVPIATAQIVNRKSILSVSFVETNPLNSIRSSLSSVFLPHAREVRSDRDTTSDPNSSVIGIAAGHIVIPADHVLEPIARSCEDTDERSEE